jgi:ribonuclease R
VEEHQESPALRDEIVALLRTKGNRLLPIREIHARLNGSGRGWSRDQVEAAVEDLEREGQVVTVRGKRYSLLEFTAFESGRIRVHPDGYGIVTTSDRDQPDIFIDRKAIRGAMNGDLVLVRADRKSTITRRGGKTFFEGEVTRVLQREHALVVGRFHDGEPPYVVPFDFRLESEIDVTRGELTPREGEMVNVEIESYGDNTRRARGRVVEVLGMIGEPGVDIEVVIRKYHIPHRFPDEVLEAAEAIPLEIPGSEIERRTDLREREIVTIDGETAKDFDDAVDVVRLENGNYRLGVHIADVAHYVTEKSVLDREAFERATSVYFPGRAVPMLPERLSNGICSLNPQVDRLTFSVVVEIDSRGRFVDREVFKSVIRTKERMTYTQVNAILTEPTDELRDSYGYLWHLFERMHELYEILRVKRESRGSIDFDLPESEVMLDAEGAIESILPSERNVAHRIIEEFMLTANEVVAQQLVFANQPGIFRVHDAPDAQKIEDLKEILEEFRHKLRGNPSELRPGDLQRVLKEVAGTPEERFLTQLVLRSMKRAVYSEENRGHFALALEHYCHFTSPIRRYPDLVIHRRLAELIDKGPAQGSKLATIESQHPMMATQSSEREKRAEDAEREVLEWKKIIFMRERVGEEFSGRITSVMPFGLFIELEEVFVQGLVPISSIAGDFWGYLEREHRLRGDSSGREFRLGDPVRILVENVDEDRRQIEFRLISASGEELPKGKKRRR